MAGKQPKTERDPSVPSSKVKGTAAMEACACFNVRQASRAITSLYDDAMEGSGIKITQLAILATIHEARSISMQDLAAELSVDPSTMTRTLRPLIDERLVSIDAPAGDRRSKLLAITPSGRRRLGAGGKRWMAAQDELCERLGKERFERFLGDLVAVNEVLGDL